MAFVRGEPRTDIEAVTLGLYLALNAPTEEATRLCIGIVESIASSANNGEGFSEHQMELAKKTALEASRSGQGLFYDGLEK